MVIVCSLQAYKGLVYHFIQFLEALMFTLILFLLGRCLQLFHGNEATLRKEDSSVYRGVWTLVVLLTYIELHCFCSSNCFAPHVETWRNAERLLLFLNLLIWLSLPIDCLLRAERREEKNSWTSTENIDSSSKNAWILLSRMQAFAGIYTMLWYLLLLF